MSLLDELRTMPPGALLPVTWIVERLEETAAEGKPIGVPDLTVSEIAAAIGRAPSTARALCASGRIEGAYRLNHREWRAPPAAVRAFLDAQTSEHTRNDAGRRGARLDAWRDHHAG